MSFETRVPWHWSETFFRYSRDDSATVFSLENPRGEAEPHQLQEKMDYHEPEKIRDPKERSFGEKLGLTIIQNVYQGNVEYFSKMLEAVKKRAEHPDAFSARGDDRKILTALRNFIARLSALPTKKELLLILNQTEDFSPNTFRSCCEEIGLRGLPGDYFYGKQGP